VYATPNSPLPACVKLRLIGVLDPDLLVAFRSAEREVGRAGRVIVLVDVCDLTVRNEADVAAIVEVIRRARAENRDVRLDRRTPAWRHAAVKHLSTVPVADEQLRSSVRRTIILAHSGATKSSTFGQ